MECKKKGVYHVGPLTEGKRNIISALMDEYEIKTAEDIQDALKDLLLGGTIRSMMESEIQTILAIRSLHAPIQKTIVMDQKPSEANTVNLR